MAIFSDYLIQAIYIYSGIRLKVSKSPGGDKKEDGGGLDWVQFPLPFDETSTEIDGANVIDMDRLTISTEKGNKRRIHKEKVDDVKAELCYFFFQYVDYTYYTPEQCGQVYACNRQERTKEGSEGGGKKCA